MQQEVWLKKNQIKFWVDWRVRWVPSILWEQDVPVHFGILNTKIQISGGNVDHGPNGCLKETTFISSFSKSLRVTISLCILKSTRWKWLDLLLPGVGGHRFKNPFLDFLLSKKRGKTPHRWLVQSIRASTTSPKNLYLYLSLSLVRYDKSKEPFLSRKVIAIKTAVNIIKRSLSRYQLTVQGKEGREFLLKISSIFPSSSFYFFFLSLTSL